MPETTVPRIECCGLVCDEQRLAEVDGRRIVALALRHELHHIRSRYGFTSPHPVLQIILGSGLTLGACAVLTPIMDWLNHGGVLPLELVYFIPMGIIGLWLLISAFRRRHFLEAVTDDGRTRLVFDRSADAAKIDAFVTGVERFWQIRVTR